MGVGMSYQIFMKKCKVGRKGQEHFKNVILSRARLRICTRRFLNDKILAIWRSWVGCSNRLTGKYQCQRNQFRATGWGLIESYWVLYCHWLQSGLRSKGPLLMYFFYPYLKTLPCVRIELTTFRLWDWRAAYCANKANVYKEMKLMCLPTFGWLRFA